MPGEKSQGTTVAPSFGERQAGRAGPGGEVEHPLPGTRRDRGHHRAAPAAVLSEGEHVVGQVIATGDRVEHRRDLVRLLVQTGAGHTAYPGTPVSAGASVRWATVTTLPAGLTPPAGHRAEQPALVVRSVPLRLADQLLALLPDESPVSWIRRGDGLVGWGVAARLETAGAGRFADTQRWWDQVSAAAVVRNEVGEPGAGLVAFGSFAFADEPGESVLIVPSVVVGRRGDTAWVTSIGSGTLQPFPRIAPGPPPRPPQDVVFGDGSLSGTAWEGVVADAVRRIDAGELDKVVLARDMVATDERRHRRPLAAGPARGALSQLLDVPRGRPVRRDTGAADQARARTGHVTGPGGDDPAYRRRPSRPGAGSARWPARARTSRSTSTPSAR